MTITIRNILIVKKESHEEADQLSSTMERWLKQNGYCVKVVDTTEVPKINNASLEVDVVVVLGGDGTLLYVARQFITKNIPFIGVNFGRVGFLTDLHPSRWEEVFCEIFLRKKYLISRRIALAYGVMRRDEKIYSGCCINDVVISRKGLARLLELNIAIGSEDNFFKFRADGVIISTPNGSTGYCAAAGGSLIYPELNVMAICPICPFLSRIRPIIIPSEKKIYVEIGGREKEMSLTIDGQEGYILYARDIVEISLHENEITFIVPEQFSYLKKLREKKYI